MASFEKKMMRPATMEIKAERKMSWDENNCGRWQSGEKLAHILRIYSSINFNGARLPSIRVLFNVQIHVGRLFGCSALEFIYRFINFVLRLPIFLLGKCNTRYTLSSHRHGQLEGVWRVGIRIDERFFFFASWRGYGRADVRHGGQVHRP